ncbi:MAG: transporter substrate-binding domain-containing protein [Bacteroidaceae bacterium]
MQLKKPSLQQKKSIRIFILVLLAIVCAWIIVDGIQKHRERLHLEAKEWRNSRLMPRTWTEILAHDTLRAVCSYNHTDFFVSGDTIRGLQYEMIQAFAKEYHLVVVITPEMNLDKQIQDLLKGKYDLIISPIAVTEQTNDSLLLSVPLIKMRQLLIQRKRNMAATQQDIELGKEPPYIKNLYQLGGRHISVTNDSTIISRIKHLAKEIGENIHIDIIENYGAEQLMQMVAHKEIDYTVAPENIAMAVIDSLPQLDSDKAISFTQMYSWGIPKRDSLLLDVVNEWLSRELVSRKYKALYKEYHIEKED